MVSHDRENSISTEDFEKQAKMFFNKPENLHPSATKLDKQADAFDAAVKSGGKFNMYGTIAGNAFYADHRPGSAESAAYKAATDKKAFKLAWAQRKQTLRGIDPGSQECSRFHALG